MSLIKTLLVVLDSDRNGLRAQQWALQRSVLIAERLKADLHLLCCRKPGTELAPHVFDALMGEALRTVSATTELAWQVEQTWRNSRAETILSVLGREQCGLLVVRSRQNHQLSELLFTPEDWKLLRYASAPVLMVNHDRPWAQRPILAAIKAESDSAQHMALNRQIIQVLEKIQLVGQAPVSLVCAYPSPMQSSLAEEQETTALQQRYRDCCKTLVQESALVSPAYVADAGPAEALIPDLAKRQDASLVVMGSVARSGLKGALLGGNTAEAILSRLTCDILTLKPQTTLEALKALFPDSDAQPQ